MNNNYINLFGINISNGSEKDTLEIIEKYVKKSQGISSKLQVLKQKPLTIFSVNPEIIIYAEKNPTFKQIVNTARINIPDGAGVIWAAKTLGRPIKKKIPGADLAEKLALVASRQNVTIGLIGGSDKIALKALECLKKQISSLSGWAENGPEISNKNNYGDWNINDFIKRVKESNTKILLVGFGYPKQEVFINEISGKLNDIVIMAVGGTFDYWSENLKRAPKFLQSLGLEWLFRLIQQPSRFQRQLAIPKFIIQVLKTKLISKNSYTFL